MGFGHGSSGPKDLEERFGEMKKLLKSLEEAYQDFGES